MAEFEKWIDGLLADEGGYNSVDNEAGAANWGITERWLTGHGLDLDVREITRDQAARLYREYFWDALRLSQIESQRVANLVGMLAANCGETGTSQRLLQRALVVLGYDTGPIDGVIGPKTIAAANAAGELALTQALKYVALDRYVRLATGNPRLYLDDLAGWRARLERL